MDFSVIFQLRTKKFWWMDVIFYFAISLLIAAVFCYVIFLLKNVVQRQDIKTETDKLEQVGTPDQKNEETEVLNYQKKFNDFADIFKNHEFASNTFAFMQAQTMPNIWFKQFTLNRVSGEVQLSGETDNLDALSRQVASLEKNKYVANLAGLSSTLGESARTQFSFSLSLDPKIFSYLADFLPPITEAASPSDQSLIQTQQASGAETAQKLITSFHLLLTPEVAGQIDQANFTIKLDVPYGTNVTDLMPSIVISPEAVVVPSSAVAQDFTNPIIYKVVAPDGTSQDYKVSVNILPNLNETPAKKSGTGLIIGIIIGILALAGAGIAVFFAWKKFKTKKTNFNI